MKKILFIFLAILSVCMVCFPVIASEPFRPELPEWTDDTEPVEDDLKSAVEGAWSTVATIVQILSVACFVFAGLRYMFASADQKADIKKGLIYLGVGALIVFSATSIAKLIATGAESMLK